MRLYYNTKDEMMRYLEAAVPVKLLESSSCRQAARVALASRKQQNKCWRNSGSCRRNEEAARSAATLSWTAAAASKAACQHGMVDDWFLVGHFALVSVCLRGWC